MAVGAVPRPRRPRRSAAQLLRGAIAAAAADGLPALGLVVSGGNPAVDLYLQEGFETVREDISVTMPD